jgi:diguanylate cyclase (GGDEF)-like protein
MPLLKTPTTTCLSRVPQSFLNATRTVRSRLARKRIAASNQSLRTRLSAFAIVLAVTTTACLALVTEEMASRQLERRIGERLGQRTTVLAHKIDQLMAERYHDMQLHAAILTDLGLLAKPLAVRTRLNELRAAHEGYAWIGYAGRDGTVLAATDALLEGVDVSQRPWFSGASRAAFVGDLHRAVLLEKKLQSNGREPLRFLDVAMPVINKDGSFAGVLGAHVDWRWIKGLTKSMPLSAQSEILLLGGDNTVLQGPSDLQDRPLSIDSVQQARKGASGYRIERWPDGKTYLTGYSQSRGYQDYPGLDWIVLERQEIGVAFAPVMELRQQFITWGMVIAALFALLGWFFAARISRPLIAITQAAESLQRGNSKTKIPLVKGYREVQVLSRTLSSLIAELTHREAELAHQATHQSLTQLPNRALIKAVLTQSIARAQQENRQISILAADLDGFKKVNETVGHAAGNAVLQAAADRLKNCLGTSGTLGHLGKDDFVLVLEERDAMLSHTTALAACVQQALAQPFLIDGVEFFLSASIGISRFPKDGEDAEALLGYGAMAVHQARTRGGNCIEFYEAQMNASVLERLSLERELRQALEKRQFELHYQPQVSLGSGALTGVEALIRWRHPELGLVSPAKFIPMAEASGLIVPIGDWVLNEACAQAQAWRKEGLPQLRISVNVSAQQFSEGALVQRVSEALALNELEPECLKLEITESLLMQEVERSIAVMKQLTLLGVHIAIDDFGTGYSSLSYLKRFPISELKIDRAFVRDLTADPDDAAIIRTIIALGHNLKLSVIAEGVETAAQAGFLRQVGCDEMQGYYFSRPVPAGKLADLLRAHNQSIAVKLFEPSSA